jgi:tetratricopeptide (TPR) repeat protein
MGFCLCLAIACPVWAGQAQDNEAAKANELYQAGKRPDALPLYENLVKRHPNEMLYWERLADCLGAEAVQLSDPAQVKALRTRERDAAKKALALGDKAEFVRSMANLDPDAPLYSGIVSPGKALLVEAEAAYSAGDFQTAMTKYEAAAAADPQLYEAPLFAGDTAYVQKDLPTAAQWFARAIAVNPNRETAYRYWGDAIFKLGNDPATAKEKFIDAIVAEPYSKFAWQGLEQWANLEKAVLQAPKIERPAGPREDPNNPTKNIQVQINPGATDETKHPGSSAWVTYSLIRASYQGDLFTKDFPNEKVYRHTLREEDAALSAVAAAVKEKGIKPESLDESLRNLLEVYDAGMLDCWILISGSDNGIEQDYAAYRDGHRQLLHDYMARFVVHGGVNPAQ